MDIQNQPMPCNELEFTILNAHGADGIAVNPKTAVELVGHDEMTQNKKGDT